MRRAAVGVSAFAVLALATFLPVRGAQEAGDWPQWRGPRRDGTAPDSTRTWNWPKEGPRRLWTAQVGIGFSSPILTKGRVITLGQLPDRRHYVHCLDADSGRSLWKQPLQVSTGEWPYSTPCTDGRSILAITADGVVGSLDVESGRVNWLVNVVEKYQCGKGGFHGIANSPLLVGDVLVLAHGIGLDKNTGRLLWQNREAITEGHASPVVCPVGRQTTVLIAWGTRLVCLDPTTGKPLWQLKKAGGPAYLDPIVSGDRILTLGGRWGKVLQFSATSVADTGWHELATGYGNANPVRWRDYLYVVMSSGAADDGSTDDSPDPSQCSLSCFDARTLKARWKKKGVHGTPIVAGGKLILQSQWGDLLVVEASPDGYKELARAKLFTHQSPDPRAKNSQGRATFNTPVLCGGRIYCRNVHGEVACLDVGGK
jgi:outer membrane protein assembly factor BamB